MNGISDPHSSNISAMLRSPTGTDTCSTFSSGSCRTNFSASNRSSSDGRSYPSPRTSTTDSTATSSYSQSEHFVEDQNRSFDGRASAIAGTATPLGALSDVVHMRQHLDDLLLKSMDFESRLQGQLESKRRR